MILWMLAITRSKLNKLFYEFTNLAEFIFELFCEFFPLLIDFLPTKFRPLLWFCTFFCSSNSFFQCLSFQLNFLDLQGVDNKFPSSLLVLFYSQVISYQLTMNAQIMVGIHFH